jgi:hypothetical protein
MALTIGTRAEILAELDQLGRDALQAGGTEKATAFAAAMAQIDRGEMAVVVRHTRYEITD